MSTQFIPQQFKFHGKAYETAPDVDGKSSCQRCAFIQSRVHKCGLEVHEDAQGNPVDSCRRPLLHRGETSMTTITMTKRGNIKVDGVKFYAVPASSTIAACDCPVSNGYTNTKCGAVRCIPQERPEGYRLAGESVWFISKERYSEFQAKENHNEATR